MSDPLPTFSNLKLEEPNIYIKKNLTSNTMEKVKEQENSGHGSLTETESDEIQDNQSVISDDQSISIFSNASWNQFNINSQKLTPQAFERLMISLKKLKKENASLKEMLEQAKINDITLLKTKLRGYNADIIRLKQVNSEQKERIQSLESKLFELLTEKERNVGFRDDGNSQDEEERTLFHEISEKLKQMQQMKKKVSDIQQYQMANLAPKQFDPSKIPSSSDTGITGQVSQQTLISKCRHYEKLIKIYEKNLSVMQNEIDRLKKDKEPQPFQTTRNGHGDRTELDDQPDQSTQVQSNLPVRTSSSESMMKSVDFAIDESMLINTTNPKKTVVLSKDVKAYLEELRYNDQKTIQELAKEVKRLTKLVPRAAIEKDEESEDSNMKSEESMGDNNHEEDLSAAIPAPENEKTTTDQFFPSRSKYDSFDETELQRRNNNYTFFQLIFSFVAGCVLMLIWLWRYLPS